MSKWQCGIQDDFEDSLISDIKYDDVAVVPDTGYLKVKSGNKYALFNTVIRSQVSDFIFDSIEPVSGSSTYIKVLQNSKWAIIELDMRSFKQVSEYKYDKIGDIIWSGYYKVYNANNCGAFYVGKRNGGAYNMDAGEVIPPYFEDIEQLGTKNYFKIRQNGLWGVYNIDTKSVIIEPKYENSAIQYRGFDTFRINGQDVKVNAVNQVSSSGNTYQNYNNTNNTNNTTVNQNINTANVSVISQTDLEKYLQRNKYYLTGPETIESPALTQMHASQNDGVSSSSDITISDLGRVELPWYNGNYLVWNTYTGYDDMYFAAEYNREKLLEGIVVIVKEEDGIFHACEYLKTDDWDIPLKSIFIYDPENNAAFLYDKNKNLKMYQINNQKKIENSSGITNNDFMTQIMLRFNNPKKYIIPFND